MSGRRGMERKPLLKTDPQIARYFRHHCEQGKSPRSFQIFIRGTESSFSWLLRNNPEFKEINEKYKFKQRGWV